MTIIDVRTTQEFVSGNVEGSLNIPLQELMNHIEEIKTMPGPMLVNMVRIIRLMVTK